MTLKLPRGDCYRIPHEKGGTRDYSFAKKAGKNLIFVDGTTLRPVPFDEQTFAKMIHEKVAVRQLSSNWLDRIDIHALMDPTLENTPKETRKKIKRAQSKVAEAAMYRFYVVLWDKTPEDKKSRSADGYTDFIEAHYQAALNAGHFHKPSYSAFRRALEKSTLMNENLSISSAKEEIITSGSGMTFGSCRNSGKLSTSSTARAARSPLICRTSSSSSWARRSKSNGRVVNAARRN